MTKITDTIYPFVTPFATPSILPPESSHTISMLPGIAEIYSDGTRTISVPIWGYEGLYPGPVIEVERNQTIEVKWVNKITAGKKMPCKADSVGFTEESGSHIPQNVLDEGQQSKPTMGASAEAFLSVHLHGGKTIQGSDGWPESMLTPKKSDSDSFQTTLCRYENQQRAMMLWYHDHAMHTTRLNNYAGLAGLWIIRDDEERALELPEGEFEIPLVIQDRNLTKFNWFSEQNCEKSQLLHRVEHEDGPLEFFGPLTLVNGRIWPRKKTKTTSYRFRILNGSNSRFYRLRFAEKEDDSGYSWIDIPTRQIGSDCGLFNKPVQLPAEGLILAPAERADIIVDFSKCTGKEIVLLNTAEAPFSNSPPLSIDQMFPADPATCKVNDEPWRTPYPEVMMFEVEEREKCSAAKEYDFSALENMMQANVISFKTEDPVSKLKSNAIVRTVVLIEKTEQKEGEDQVVLVEWELTPKAHVEENASMPILSAQREVIIDGEEFLVLAERFQDPVTWMVKLNDTEKWRFINLTADTHPMHIHLVQFKAVSRKKVELADTSCILSDGTPASTDDIVEVIDCKSQNQEPIEINVLNQLSLDENEQGFKDTIRVNPNEMVEIVATFEGYCGRYVYHCHLLEHEDHDMMRQFVVTRNDLNMMHGMGVSIGAN